MEYRKNLQDWLKMAGPAEIEAGKAWYREANAVAQSLAHKHGVTVECAAGVLAVLSPQCHWHDNVRAAENALATYRRGGTPSDAAAGTSAYGVNFVKAFRIIGDPMFGREGSVCDGTRTGKRGGRVKCTGTRCGCQAPLHGPKVAAFYAAILGAPDGAVDVWATRAADCSPAEVLDDLIAADDPRREGDPTGRHADITAAYAAAGRKFGLAGHEAQAVVWVTIRAVWRRADGRINAQRRDDLPF